MSELPDGAARDHLRLLLSNAVQEALDDPGPDAAETWAEHANLAAASGWDIWEIARSVGTDHEVARMRGLVNS